MLALMVTGCDTSTEETTSTEESTITYAVNDSGQTSCYSSDITAGETGEIDCPESGEAMYGQDAQFADQPMSFTKNDDGTTTDNITGLMWQTTPAEDGGDNDDPDAAGYFFLVGAQAYAEDLVLGGYDDWRLPTTKELYSISDFGSGWPYIDEDYFDLALPGEYDKSEQYWGTAYVGHTEEGGFDAASGVNHMTGHIKAYPSGDETSGVDYDTYTYDNGESAEVIEFSPPSSDTTTDTTTTADADAETVTVEGPVSQGKRVRVVRGGTNDEDEVTYGINDFVANDDGTVSDNATGLMWQSSDNDGETMNWTEALAFAEDATTGNYDDWRLPSVKELQSIVDYSKSPTALLEENVGPAIDSDFFTLTPVAHDLTSTYARFTTDDYGYYWTSTSAYFGSDNPEYYFAWYVAFGSAVDGDGNDYHGAGGVRFDTKIAYDESTNITAGDPERVTNYVLLVRDID